VRKTKTAKNLRSPKRRLLKDVNKPMSSIGQQPLDFFGDRRKEKSGEVSKRVRDFKKKD
jgi:hypothetical protein